MKNVRRDLADSLRPEYNRSDFGEMVQGKYGSSQIEFAELVRLLLTCASEDEGVKFLDHSIGNQLAAHKRGDWTYEIDANQITLRYWLNEFGSIDEQISNPPRVTTAEERSDLQKLIANHTRTLKARVDELEA